MSDATLGDREFDAFRALIFQSTGISLGDGKRQLVAARLGKRLRALGINDFAAYHAVLRSARAGNELQCMVNAITTNKTHFFRESHHFETLAKVFQKSAGAPVRIWSAGCSTGEEPYSIAMVARETLGDTAPGVQLLASDVDTDVLALAAAGVYDNTRMDGVSDARRRRHFLSGRGSAVGSWRANDAMRALITFRQINFVDTDWGVSSGLDVIFCRNVIIYFNRETQERLLGEFAALLRPGGLLILGHSESLHGLSNVFEGRGNTVYQRCGLAAVAKKFASQLSTAQRPIAHATPVPAEPPITRIVAGGVFASREPAVVTTLLGSCVAVCLRDPVTGIGGMNHFVLPYGDDGDLNRYGVHAMELLINRIMSLGGDRRRFEAKIFGACSVLNFPQRPDSVTERNAVFVRAFLALEHIPVRAERLGGDRPLEVRFNTATGRVLLRKLPPSNYGKLASDGARYRREIARELAVSDVTLFTSDS